MFDLGWAELLVIAIVALVVVGPKDLPGMFRTVGRFIGKARGMARDFQRSMEAAADEAGIKEAGETLRDVGNLARDPLAQARKSASDYAKTVKKSVVEDTDTKAEPAKADAPAASASTPASETKTAPAKATETATPGPTEDTSADKAAT